LFAGPRAIDPAAWGGDHVGKPVPEFASGDECLFCHRSDVGPSWAANRHGRTVRRVEPGTAAVVALRAAPQLKGLAAEAEFVLGGDNRQRYLRPGKEQGKVELLSVEWAPSRKGSEGKLLATERPHWDARKFGDGCAGCHATGVDGAARTFAAVSLDCYACHGDVPGKHAKEPGLAYLSPKRRDPARVVTSICAQCHLRTGTARSTGLPYPNNFVAGDNLFRDFQVDLAPEPIRRLNPGDAHVLDNVRDVVLLGKEDVTCLTCHDIHKQSAKKHHRVAEGDSCLRCHEAMGSKKVRKGYEVHSTTCGY
jgi:hypothetical protein